MKCYLFPNRFFNLDRPYDVPMATTCSNLDREVQCSIPVSGVITISSLSSVQKVKIPTLSIDWRSYIVQIASKLKIHYCERQLRFLRCHMLNVLAICTYDTVKSEAVFHSSDQHDLNLYWPEHICPHSFYTLSLWIHVKLSFKPKLCFFSTAIPSIVFIIHCILNVIMCK